MESRYVMTDNIQPFGCRQDEIFEDSNNVESHEEKSVYITVYCRIHCLFQEYKYTYITQYVAYHEEWYVCVDVLYVVESKINLMRVKTMFPTSVVFGIEVTSTTTVQISQRENVISNCDQGILHSENQNTKCNYPIIVVVFIILVSINVKQVNVV